MAAGRKPKPTHLKLLEGNAGNRPMNPNEPQPVGNLDAPPAWLSDEQKASWRYALAHAPQGLLKMIDSSLLVVWVVAESYHREAVETIKRDGMLANATTNAGQEYQSPYMNIVNKQALIMMKAAAELGFTPSSRSQISVQAPRGNAFANNGRRGNPAA